MSTAGRDVITASEIVTARVTDAYQAVVQLRPEFLRRRYATAVPSINNRVAVVVYLDDLRLGSVETLRQIPLDRVRLIRYMQPEDAAIRWGTTHSAGAILVTTLK